ncbi:hypothetical protein [Moorena sp. SIO3B2]|uniref:hypothetical protein n=1 Tax=Moorena sp. SIO3B2 TaxID=2607827 RepID=UPI00257A6A3F|nr:hypothetical protein [Moorena sp. SIO3B2]
MLCAYNFPIPVSRLPTPASRLPTPDSRLPTPDSRLPTPDSRLPTRSVVSSRKILSIVVMLVKVFPNSRTQ